MDIELFSRPNLHERMYMIKAHLGRPEVLNKLTTSTYNGLFLSMSSMTSWVVLALASHLSVSRRLS